MKLRSVDWFFITALLLLATGLRFTGLSFGQPDPRYAASTMPYGLLQLEAVVHPDEFQFVSIPLRMLAANVFRTGYLINPTLLTNLNLLTFWLSGAAEGIDHEARQQLPDSGRQYAPFHLYVIGRVYSALSGVLGVAAIYATTRLLAGGYAAAAAGLLGAAAFTLVQHSHYTTQTNLSAALVALSVLASCLALRRESRQRFFYVLACIFAGLAFSSRYNAGAVFIVPVLVGLVLLSRNRSGRTLRTIAAGFLAFPVFFVLGTPYVLIERRLFINDLLYGFQHYVGGLDNPIAFENGLFYSYRHLVIFSVGAVAACLALIGLYLAVRRVTLRQIVGILLVYVVAYSVVVLQATRLGSDQLIVPILPVVIIFAGIGCGWLSLYFTGRARSFAWVALVLAMLLVPLTLSVQFSRQLKPDTRHIMQAWFAQHVPKGAQVHLNGPYNLPLDSEDYNWSQTYGGQLISPDELTALGADYMVVSDAWYQHIFNSGEVMKADYLQTLADYLALIDERYELIASIDRPQWTGYDWGIAHTASYWHNPGLKVYCLNSEVCGQLVAQSP